MPNTPQWPTTGSATIRIAATVQLRTALQQALQALKAGLEAPGEA